MTNLSPNQFKRVKNYFDSVLDPYNVVTPGSKRQGMSPESLSIWTDDTSMRYAHKTMGDFQGKHILDIGCGLGMHLVWLANKGAFVTGIDVSDKRIEMAKRLIKKEGLEDSVTLYIGDALNTKLPEESFDIVYGQDILMYFGGEYSKFINETKRILKKGGSLVISEALNGHPVANFFRKYIAPDAWKDFTHYFSLSYIKDLENAFDLVRYKTFYLTGIIIYLIKVYLPLSGLYWIYFLLDVFFNHLDSVIFRLFPNLQKYSWRIVFEAKK